MMHFCLQDLYSFLKAASRNCPALRRHTHASTADPPEFETRTHAQTRVYVICNALVGGLGPIGTALPYDGALMQAQLNQPN